MGFGALLGTLAGATQTPPTSAMAVEPFTPPDVSELSDRELMEAVYLKLCVSEHLIRQTMLSAQSSPLLASFIPRP